MGRLALAEAAVVALVAADLRPGVGEPVSFFATWGGAWPADVRWSGVTTSDGLTATLVPAAPGEVAVQAGDAVVVLQVQPAANHGATRVEPLVLPLLDLDADRCRDARYPALAGAWVVGCSSSGKVDRAVHLGTRAVVSLEQAVAAPGLGPGVLYDPIAGLWRLPDAAPTPLPRLPGDAVAPPATDGEHAAVALVDHVEAYALDAKARTHTDARPLPGQRVALAWPLAAWVQREPLTDEDVWLRDADGRGKPLARGPGAEWHVAADGHWVAWAGPDAVWVQDMARGERRRYPADTGFFGGLGLWGPVACWEDRAELRAGTGDVDVRCGDGVVIRRPGHQVQPGRIGPWVVFREEGRVMVATVPELVLDDDDPRAEGAGATVAGGHRGAHREGGVTWTLEWPAEGWRIERWVDGAWVPGEALPVGRVTIVHPGGDAVRLRPATPGDSGGR